MVSSILATLRIKKKLMNRSKQEGEWYSSTSCELLSRIGSTSPQTVDLSRRGKKNHEFNGIAI
ncbi:MAG: hypothetical protein C4527_14890 [Candidatus Omnitrophota bacterium]|nr:MAG: hypothetical protein C4527_14890 [Candidatus Omnitrophota bacterium]